MSKEAHKARFVCGPWAMQEKTVRGFPLSLYVPAFYAYYYALWSRDGEGTLVYQWVTR